MHGEPKTGRSSSISVPVSHGENKSLERDAFMGCYRRAALREAARLGLSLPIELFEYYAE